MLSGRLWTCVVTALLAAASGLVPAAATAAEEPQVLNVVLIELNTDTAGAPPPLILNDWSYWEARAGTLLMRLDKDFGLVRAHESGNGAAASLFALRAAVAGLEDESQLAPLLGQLDRIGRKTQRPSFLIVWLSPQGYVFLGLHDQVNWPAAAAFAICRTLLGPPADSGLLQLAATGYVLPPCLIACDRRSTVPGAPSATPMLAAGRLELVLHCLNACRVTVAVRASLLTDLNQARPAGATLCMQKLDDIVKSGGTPQKVVSLRNSLISAPDSFQQSFLAGPWRTAMEKNPALAVQTSKFFETNTMDIFKQLDRTTINQIGGGAQGATLGGQFNVAWQKGENALQHAQLTMNRAMTPMQTLRDPGGILFKPDLVIVIDKNGPTTALASGAKTTVHGKPGGTFEHGDESYLAVKTPGTAGLFRVPTGGFRSNQTDLSAGTPGADFVRLTRYYDSTAPISGAADFGWSFVPYALELDTLPDDGETQHRPASKPVFVDREAGVRLPYALIADVPTTQPAQAATAVYRKLSSTLQPELIALGEGGYLAVFAHGLQLAFDSTGRLLWSGRGEAERVRYTYDAGQLTEVRGAAGRIVLEYDAARHLVGASSPDGRQVRYTLDPAGRLASVTSPECGALDFTYGDDGRLATVTRAAEPRVVVAGNTYDASGRMLVHRTSEGEWAYAYNDDVGLLRVTDPGKRVIEYYYDAHEHLIAYGAARDQMTLVNYDISGRILQVARAEMISNPADAERPAFKISEVIAPLVSESETKPENG